MKYLPLLFVFTLAGIKVKGQPEFGIFAGPQITSAKYITPEINLGSTKQNTSLKYGFQAGAMARMSFEGRFYFTPMAFYSLKGFKVDFSRPSFPPDSAAVDNDLTIHTFEIAPLFQYNFSNQENHFFVKGGLSFDAQLMGREKFNLNPGGLVSRKMRFGFNEYGYLGASLLVHLGYETSSGFIIFAHYNHGVGSIINTDNGPRAWHRAAGISIGKYFSRK